jgi:multiple sugar transport system substrate-binding protein
MQLSYSLIQTARKNILPALILELPASVSVSYGREGESSSVIVRRLRFIRRRIMSKPLSRRSFLRASALSTGAVVIAACAPQVGPAPSSDEKKVVATLVAKSDEKIKLVYSHWGNEDEKASTRATLDAFMKENSNVDVEQMYIPEAGDPYLQKMSAMAASNTLPDAALFPDGSTLDWALKGMFLDLSDIYTGEHEKVEAITYRTPDGKIAGVAGAQEIALIWYNKDMLKEADVQTPPVTAETAWNWEDFLIIAKQLTVDTKGSTALDASFDPANIDRFGFQMGLWDMMYYAFMRSNGGDFFNEDFSEITLDRPENYEALQQIADLMNKHYVKPAFNASGGVGALSTSNALLSKKIGMVMDGQWVLETLNKMRREEGLSFGIGVLPYLKEPVTTAVGGPIIAFKTSKTPDMAKKLVSFIMDPHQTPEYIQGGLWMPNEKRWYTQPDLLAKWIDNENHPPEYKTAVVDYSKKVNRPMPIYRMPGYSALNQIITPALEQIWLGKAKPEESFEAIVGQAKKHFDENILPLMKG